MATHMNQQPAQALIDFITEFIVYVSSTQKISIEPEESDSDQDRRDIMDVSIFNEYFSRQENKEQINKLAAKYSLRPEFFITVSVVLSHWIYKLGYC